MGSKIMELNSDILWYQLGGQPECPSEPDPDLLGSEWSSV